MSYSVLIVDDSALLRSILREVLRESGKFSVVGEASNGEKAVELTVELKPDIVIMDINMPIMNGIEATGAIMEKYPVPILILSGEIDAEQSFIAIKNGAVETMKKPDLDRFNDPRFAAAFMQMLEKVASSKRNRKSGEVKSIKIDSNNSYKAVVIGASTGGPAAVCRILQALPANFPLGIALVQHLETGFDRGYAEWLNTETALNVRLANKEDRITPGTVLVAPTDFHLKCRGLKVYLDDGPKVLNQKPAVEALFHTAAETLKDECIGVLLTGMGTDGALGCVAIKEHGGMTIVQDEESSVIFGMPKAAIEKGGARVILPLGSIAEYLIELAGR